MCVFLPADILIPRVDEMDKWAVIACDQFTSQPDYWKKVQSYVGQSASALNLILPEVMLTGDCSTAIEEINANMERYLANGIFTEYQNAFVYVERTLQNGSVRKGIVGAIDLEAYDYSEGSVSDIRATEKTVVERIPPRKKIRKNAALELPHVLLLCDDDQDLLIGKLAEIKNQLPKLYEFDLMENGGHIAGWLVQGKEANSFCERLDGYCKAAPQKYEGLNGSPVLFAVGDGNHSLATAKACYEELKAKAPTETLIHHPARYALVELENIHDPSLQFEPIHRIMSEVDPDELLHAIGMICAENGYPVEWHAGGRSGVIYLDRARGELPVGILQAFLDEYMKNGCGKIDYIHGEAALNQLAAQENSVGFILPPIEKSQLFRGIISDGVLPRKTFSMGHAEEKRYYIEARKIR